MLEFTFTSARGVFEDLAPKPPPEPPRVAAARQLLERTPADARDQIGAELIRQAKSADEVNALHGIVRQMLDADAQAAEENLVRQVTQALAEPDEHRPYRDDDGNVRDPSGNVIDPASEDWWDRPWAGDVAKLLGPEWMVGHNPGDN